MKNRLAFFQFWKNKLFEFSKRAESVFRFPTNFVQNISVMDFETTAAFAGYANTLSDYEIERDKPMPNKIHSVVQSRLARFLGNRYEKQYEFATELTFETPDRPTTPDISVLKKEPIDWLDIAPRETQPPLVAIEIASPSQGFSVFKEKAERYFEFGVGSYWLVQPNLKTIYVFSSPSKYSTFINSDVVLDPSLGLEVPLDEIFN